MAGQPHRNIARLTAIGQRDPSFSQANGQGPDAMVKALELQADGRTLIAGDFTSVEGIIRAATARLLGDASGQSSLALWRFIYFGTTENESVAANGVIRFQDGITNLEKYAFNIDPLVPAYHRMTDTGNSGLPLTGRSASGQLTLTFVRRKAATFPGIKYDVEFTSSLTTAFAVNPAATELATEVTPLSATWERVVVTDSFAPPAASRRFVRLRIYEP